MYNKKICILGDPAVGKTCLVQRFLKRGFDETYTATQGADIDKVQLQVERDKLQLMLWDIQGQDRSSQQYFAYLKGVSAIIYVVDGTRLQTLDTALEYRQMIENRNLRRVPAIMLFNKSDLAGDWEIGAGMINDVESEGIFSLLTSAKEGTGVDTAFNLLSRVLIGKATLVAA